MTEKEYNAACSELISRYFQEEEKIIARAKRDGTWNPKEGSNYYLYLRLNLKMRRELLNLQDQYMHSRFPIHN